MPQVFDLTEQYRNQLTQREDLARAAMLKDYRGVWNGLDDKIEKAAGRIEFSDSEKTDLADAFKDELANADPNGGPADLPEDKLSRFTDLLLKKNSWQELEKNLDGQFRDVADNAAQVTESHRQSLSQTAVDHAVKLMQAQLGKERVAGMSKEALEELNKRAKDQVEQMWQEQHDDLQEKFRAKAGEVSARAREALRQEVLHGILVNATAKQILGRVKQAIDDRENHPEKDPTLVRALHSEYRIATQNSYRESMRFVFSESGRVSQWRWTSARTAKTCAVCWAMDGKVFSVDTPLKSHPHCRCVPIPIVEDAQGNALRSTEREGGETGETAFADIPAPQQKAILGMKAFDAYERGEFDLSDLIGVQFNTRFGVALYRQSVDAAIKTSQVKAPDGDGEELQVTSMMTGKSNGSGLLRGSLNFLGSAPINLTGASLTGQSSDSAAFTYGDRYIVEPENGYGGFWQNNGGDVTALSYEPQNKPQTKPGYKVYTTEFVSLPVAKGENQFSFEKRALAKHGRDAGLQGADLTDFVNKWTNPEDDNAGYEMGITGSKKNETLSADSFKKAKSIRYSLTAVILKDLQERQQAAYENGRLRGQKSVPKKVEADSTAGSEDGSAKNDSKTDDGSDDGSGGGQDRSGPSPIPGMSNAAYKQMLEENPGLIPMPRELVDPQMWNDMTKMLQEGQIPRLYTPKDPEEAKKLNELRQLIKDDIQKYVKTILENKDAPDLYKAFQNFNMENVIKDAIDKRWADYKGDLRKVDEDGNGDTKEENVRREVNQAMDSLEQSFRDDLSTDNWSWSDMLNPAAIPAKMAMRYWAPDSVKEGVINLEMGLVKGTIGLASVVNGVARFTPDLMVDAFIKAANWAGVDTSGMEKYVSDQREKERKVWNALLNGESRKMANAEYSYKTKQQLGVRTVPYDVPNWMSKTGTTAVRMAPYIAVTVLTGGSAAPIILLAAADAGGQTYTQTGNHGFALMAAAVNAGQTAAGGLVAEYGGGSVVGGQISNAAILYVTMLAQGEKDPNKIFQELMINGALNYASDKAVKVAIEKRAGKPLSDQELYRIAFDDLKQGVAEGSVHNANELSGKVELETVRKMTRTETEIYKRTGKSVKPEDIPISTQGQKMSTQERRALSDIKKNWGGDNKITTQSEMRQAVSELRDLSISAGELRANGDGTIVLDHGLPTLDSVAGAFASAKKIAKFHLEAFMKQGQMSIEAFTDLMMSQVGRFFALKKEIVERLYNESVSETGIKGRPRPFLIKKLRTGDELKTVIENDPSPARPDPNDELPQKPNKNKKKDEEKQNRNLNREDQTELEKVTRQVDALVGKAYDKSLLPEGYHAFETDEGTVIRRNPGKRGQEYPQLRLDENDNFAKGAGGPGRISQPGKLVKNVQAELVKHFETLNIDYDGRTPEQYTADLISKNFELHHLLTDDAIQVTDLGKAAQAAGYDLDNTRNGLAIAKSKESMQNKFLKEIADGTDMVEADSYHKGSHPEYSKKVKAQLEKSEAEFREQFKKELRRPDINGDLNKLVQKNETARRSLLGRMKALEEYFRDYIRSGAARKGDGRIGLLLPTEENARDTA